LDNGRSGIFERKTVRKIYGPKKDKGLRITHKRQIARERYCKIYKIPIRWYGHVERRQNQRMAKEIATATMEASRKKGRPCKRWPDKVEEGLNIMGTQTGK
jgi:hypothetical protein